MCHRHQSFAWLRLWCLSQNSYSHVDMLPKKRMLPSCFPGVGSVCLVCSQRLIRCPQKLKLNPQVEGAAEADLEIRSCNHKKSRTNPLLSFISCSWASVLVRSQRFHCTKLHPDSRSGVCSSVETRMDEAKVDLSAAGYLPCSSSASHVQLAVSFANGPCFYCWNPQEQTTTKWNLKKRKHSIRI